MPMRRGQRRRRSLPASTSIQLAFQVLREKNPAVNWDEVDAETRRVTIGVVNCIFRAATVCPLETRAQIAAWLLGADGARPPA